MDRRYLYSTFLMMTFLSLAGSQPPPGKGRSTPRIRPAELTVNLLEPPISWVKNPRAFERSTDPRTPKHYTLTGDTEWATCTTSAESTEYGFALYSGLDFNKDGTRSGSVSQTVTGFPTGVGKWYRFTIRGLAEPEFQVKNGGLILGVEFFANHGKNPLDGVTRDLSPLVEQDRKELAQNGVKRKNGGAVWKTYSLDFRLPFAEIDTLNLSVRCKNGSASTDEKSEFYAAAFHLEAIEPPSSAANVIQSPRGPAPALSLMIPLGGRWYYHPEPTQKTLPDKLIVNAINADRLYYHDGRLSNPFAQNMTAWLRKGMLDGAGKLVEVDRFVPDNVILEFRDRTTLIVHTRNIPNHPTASFPEQFRGGTPNSIQERDTTYYLPLEPKRNPKAVAMDATNSNRALPMGTIAFAINGVAFFNPFDMGGEEAVDLMDRCCGHPAPDNRYHYHKYPVCVKSPFIDDGETQSPLIGFALDGFPIYGPYESKRLMAKDDKTNPIDAFNMHHDETRGWHYHVTPGKFPYIIGGYAGTPDPRSQRKGPPR